MPKQTRDELLTTKEVSDLLKLSESTVRRHARNGDIASQFDGRRRQFRHSAVLEFMESRDQGVGSSMVGATPAEWKFRPLSRRKLIKAGVSVVGALLLNDLSEKFDTWDPILMTPRLSQWMNDVKNGVLGGSSDDIQPAVWPAERFAQLFFRMNLAEQQSLSLGRTSYTSGYHPDNLAAAGALLEPLGALKHELTTRVQQTISLPEAGNIVLIGGTTSTPITAIAFEFSGPTKDVQRRSEAPIIPLPYYGFSDATPLGSRSVGWILEKGNADSSHKPVASYAWPFICTQPNERQPHPSLYPTLSADSLSVDGTMVNVPLNNFLLVTVLPNFVDPHFIDFLGEDREAWPRMVVFAGSSGLGTRAVELLLQAENGGILDQIDDELSGASEFQVLIEVGDIELDGGFHKAHSIHQVVDVRPLNLGRAIYAEAYGYAQARLEVL